MALLTQQNFPQTSAPFVDPATGMINQTWLQLLIALWNRTGQSMGDIGDQTTLATLGLSDDGFDLTGHANLWTAPQYFNQTGGTNVTFQNINAATPGSRATGWYNNTLLPGSLVLTPGRVLIGEAAINGGLNTANTEWVETLSQGTTLICQTASVNTTGGIGLLGCSRTSDAPDLGVTQNQGTQGITAIVLNDHQTSLQTAYGFYGESWKTATAKAENISQVMELTIVNNFATTATTNPYNSSPTGLTEGARIAVGKGAQGKAASTALCIVSTGTNPAAQFGKGIVFASNALDSNNVAIALAKSHQLVWYKPDGSHSSIIRCDVDTGETSLNLIFADDILAIQDVGGTGNKFIFDNTGPNSTVNANKVQFRGSLVYINANQTIADSMDTRISFTTANYDTNSFFSGGSPTKLTVPSGLNIKKVRLSCNLQYDNNTTGSRNIQINKNGSGSYIGRIGMAGSAADTGGGFSLNGVTGVISVSPGDYFELNTSQNSGGNLDAQATNTWLSIEVVE